MLSDAQWERIGPELPGKVGDPGGRDRDNRLFIEAVLWIARTGSPWRDLPESFGKWFTAYTCFWRWAQKGVWERVFRALCGDPDFEYVLIDGTLVRVHQHGTGAKGGLKIRP
jgi:putative transposase